MEEKSKQEQIQIERQLLPQRLLVFLGISSILFIGFATLEDCWFLRLGLAIIGILMSILSFFHFYPIYKRLKSLEESQGKVASAQRKGCWKYFSGRIVALWLSFLFLALWSLSLAATLYYWK